jgi:hypothetical protein
MSRYRGRWVESVTDDRVEETASTDAGGDTAAAAGRLAGKAVTSVGRRLLRLRSVREAIRRTAEAAAPDPPEPGER